MLKWEDGVKISDARIDENGIVVEAEYEGNTPLTAYNLNQAQQELVEDMSKTYIGANITAPTISGYGRINKLYGKTTEIGTGEKNPNNSYELKCVGEDVNLFKPTETNKTISGVKISVVNEEIEVKGQATAFEEYTLQTITLPKGKYNIKIFVEDEEITIKTLAFLVKDQL